MKKFFNQKELFQLITSNFYSILFNNSEIWHLPTITATLNRKLLSASACAQGVCWKNENNYVSFESLHKLSQRATPDQFIKYKIALCLFKMYNINYNNIEFIRLNLNQVLTSRQTHFITSKSNNLKIGVNCLTNRLYLFNGIIPLSWLNDSINTF